MIPEFRKLLGDAKQWTEHLELPSELSLIHILITIVSTLAWGLGYFGMPHILLRFMAIEDDSKLKISRRVASIWVVISMAVAVLIGIIGLEARIPERITPANNAANSPFWLSS